MSDNGTSEDVVANAGVYTARTPAYPAGTRVQYYVEARASDSGQDHPVLPDLNRARGSELFSDDRWEQIVPREDQYAGGRQRHNHPRSLG
jgi:hypothetical protein